MAQLIVRRIEDAVVTRLRQRARRNGISMEEEHRRLLREVLLEQRDGRRMNLKDYLTTQPDAGEDEMFARPRARARPVKL